MPPASSIMASLAQRTAPDASSFRITVASKSKRCSIGRGAPRGRCARGGKKILRPVGNAVEGAAPAAGGNLRIGTAGLPESVIAHHGDHGVVARADALEPVEIELG